MKTELEIRKKLDAADTILSLLNSREIKDPDKQFQKAIDASMLSGTISTLEWVLEELEDNE